MTDLTPLPPDPMPAEDSPADRIVVEWGNITPEGDYVPRATENLARGTAAARGWPLIRRTVTAWTLVHD